MRSTLTFSSYQWTVDANVIRFADARAGGGDSHLMMIPCDDQREYNESSGDRDHFDFTTGCKHNVDNSLFTYHADPEPH